MMQRLNETTTLFLVLLQLCWSWFISENGQEFLDNLNLQQSEA